MTDDTPSLVARVADLDADLTAAERLTVAYLASAEGSHTRQAIAAATGATASATLPTLRNAGLVERRERETDNGGRNPYVYELTAETRAALDTETPEWDAADLRSRVIRDLAAMHYERTLSSTTSKRLAREIPGASSKAVSNALRRLSDDGVVECVKRETPANYRLVGAGLYTPYQALPQAATDGGTDR